MIDFNERYRILIECFFKVFNEIGHCLNLLYNTFGDDFLKYLQLTYLPTLQLSSQIIQVI